MIFSAHYKPYGFKKINRVLAFNDYTISLCVILSALFTDYIGNQEMKYTIGWFFVGAIGLNIIVNYSFILPTSGKQLLFISKTKYNHSQHKVKKMAA